MRTVGAMAASEVRLKVCTVPVMVADLFDDPTKAMRFGGVSPHAAPDRDKHTRFGPGPQGALGGLACQNWPLGVTPKAPLRLHPTARPSHRRPSRPLAGSLVCLTAAM